jgi:hypothetical protein
LEVLLFWYHLGGSGSSSFVNIGMISSPDSNLIGMILSLAPISVFEDDPMSVFEDSAFDV